MTNSSERCSVLTHGMRESEALLWRFCDAVKEGKAPDLSDLQALAESFNAILGGCDPKKALNLSKEQSSGRKAGSREKKGLSAACRVEELIRYKKLKIKEALIIVSEQMISEGSLKTNINEKGFIHDTLQKHWDRYKDKAKSWLDIRELLDREREQTKWIFSRLAHVVADRDERDLITSKTSCRGLIQILDYLENLDSKERTKETSRIIKILGE